MSKSLRWHRPIRGEHELVSVNFNEFLYTIQVAEYFGMPDSESPTGVILGVDPGLNITGYGVIQKGKSGPRILEAGILRVSKEKAELAARLRHLSEGISEVIQQFRPTLMAVEQLYAHYAHPRTAILMGHARGVLLLAGALANVPVRSFNATMIKKTITGSGRAPKPQVQRAVQRELGLTTMPEPPDVADALAVALCAFYLERPEGPA